MCASQLLLRRCARAPSVLRLKDGARAASLRRSARSEGKARTCHEAFATAAGASGRMSSSAVWQQDQVDHPRVLTYYGREMAVLDAASDGEVALRYLHRPERVLLIRSHASEAAIALAPRVVKFLSSELGLLVYSDEGCVEQVRESGALDCRDQILPFDARIRPEIDLVVCLGGDGLLLHICSQMFGAGFLPPIASFNLGSMGFMNPFDHTQVFDVLRRIVTRSNDKHPATVRSRLSLSISRKGADGHFHVEQTQVLNDIVLERGNDPGLSNLDAYCDGVLLTRVQADGCVISTTTGSTAYSLSCNGSMVHPMVKAILFTPICPHSLSFRPIILPDTCALIVKPADNARRGAQVRVDGRSIGPLDKQESLLISKSAWPVVVFARRSTSEDWFASVRKCLHWNEMMLEMPFEVDSMDTVQAHDRSTLQTLPGVSHLHREDYLS
ncbi:NAD(H) kinase 1 [Porphyridium purpureum]|uniref:NAD(H) kinase 1 n=1 Tax=Porphyridium purpureum TaxID=35688 RepID=A0A5J4YRS3_PORPP|nr:NAD(H) kinase 1 [Porphyridium purpureum]|eukprot:POR2893..scf236_6